MKRTYKGPAAAAGFCLLCALILFAISAAVYGIAGNGRLLGEEMRRCAPPGTTGLPDEHYHDMGRMIADYLMGRRPDFQYCFTSENGEQVTCFRQHEAAHMADVRGLIRTAGVIRLITGGAVLMLVIAGIMFRKRRKSFAVGMLAGFCLAAAFFMALLVWGLIDFDGLFIAFHRVAFTNEGWLLDSRTDMLIRLMPTPFFISMGVRLLRAVLAMVAVSFAAAVIIRKPDKKDENTEGKPAAAADLRAG